MPKIATLSPHVADLIAAGEVVERPASVVKELIENSIDAGAATVTVEIQAGGMRYIRVTDNGCGIDPEDAPTAFLRHATSKIRTEYDLEAIGTLGFRGEALAAISAVSRVELMTRTKDASYGTAVQMEGGEKVSQEEVGCPEGTTMIVRDLFFNTPARLKFMKRDSAEGAAVFTVVQHEALAHPEISFRFIREGKEELLTPGDGKLQSALYAVLGREAALGFLECPGYGDDIRVEGYVSRPACCRGSRAAQFFFVNGRYVKSKTMTAALEEAYKNQKMVGKFPACVVKLTTKLNAVDVNVHPAKTEVKFTNEKQLFEAVYYAVKSVLEMETGHVKAVMPASPPAKPQRQDTVTPNQTFFKTMTSEEYRKSGGDTLRSTAVAGYDTRVSPWQAATSRNAAQLYAKQQQREQERREGKEREQQEIKAVLEALELQKKDPPPIQPKKPVPPELVWAAEPVKKQERTPIPLRETPLPKEEPKPELKAEAKPVSAPAMKEPEIVTAQEVTITPETPQWRLVGEVLDTYIIVQQGEQVIFIDKHAAHERMNFDKMKAQDYTPMRQILLTPVVVKCDPAESEVLLRNLELLASFGFEAEDFGGGDILVREVPDYVEGDEADRVLTEIAQELLENGTADPTTARDHVLHTMACKAAIKGGWKNEPAELEVVAKAVMDGTVKYCPHGRPVAIEMTKYQLEKQFKRS
ncbi:MAG: DNA mismatch repair endonuclease MutL [Oscillospiraceae bacterium]|nr:DNA mismatch repair endonuclease MutL [Oscillospiraceae bacterium]